MGHRSHSVIAILDLVVLALALPVFILADFSLAGYVVAAAVWGTQRLVQVWAERKAKSELAAGRRNKAMGAVGATSLARPWFMAAAVLVTGIIDREVGLAAAALLAVLFTVNMGTRGLTYLLNPSEKPEESR